VGNECDEIPKPTRTLQRTPPRNVPEISPIKEIQQTPIENTEKLKPKETFENIKAVNRDEVPVRSANKNRGPVQRSPAKKSDSNPVPNTRSNTKYDFESALKSNEKTIKRKEKLK
jgi:hypothetical protein